MLNGNEVCIDGTRSISNDDELCRGALHARVALILQTGVSFLDECESDSGITRK